MAAVSFSLCGFQAVHATHEPFYTLMPYLPLALWLAGRYRRDGAGGLARGAGAGAGRSVDDRPFSDPDVDGRPGLARGGMAGGRPTDGPWRRRRPGIRPSGGGWRSRRCNSALSWDFARSVGQTSRKVADLAFFSFPPAHWIEPALPWFFRGLRHGGEDPYWFGQGTTGYEAMFYLGTIPLALAFVGWIDGGRGRPSTWFWRSRPRREPPPGDHAAMVARRLRPPPEPPRPGLLPGPCALHPDRELRPVAPGRAGVRPPGLVATMAGRDVRGRRVRRVRLPVRPLVGGTARLPVDELVRSASRSAW